LLVGFTYETTNESTPTFASPKVLELTAVEEITVMDHLDMLELNGFGVQVDDSAPVGGRVRLVAQPVSGNTSWDVSGESGG
jgi:DNA mismatch repair protein PMS2